MLPIAIIDRSEFHRALALAKRGVEKRSTIPILKNLALVSEPEGLYMRVTDLDRMISIRLGNSSAGAGFGTTLPAIALHDMERKVPESETLSIDIGDGSDVLNFEGAFYKINSLPIADFPIMEFGGEIKADFNIATEDFLKALLAVELAISTEETRYYLNGVFMESVFENGVNRLNFIATDGHRMARHCIDLPDDAITGWSVIVPRATVEYLINTAKTKGADPVTRIIVNSVKARFITGEVDTISKMVDGTFPDYRRVIPGNIETVITVDRKAMIKGIEAVMAISTAVRRVRCSFVEGAAHLFVSDPDAGEANFDLPAALVGESKVVTIDPRYAVEILKAIGGDDAEILISADVGAPLRLRRVGNGTTEYVLMPRRD